VNFRNLVNLFSSRENFKIGVNFEFWLNLNFELKNFGLAVELDIASILLIFDYIGYITLVVVSA